MDALLAQCRWPNLQEPYNQALRDAVGFILEQFDVLGIIASGTIIRGNPHPNSDLDIFVIHARQERQRVQKFFNGIPAEIFVNPPNMISQYFVDEIRRGRPSTAHMLSTGFVVLDRDPVIEQLRQESAALLEGNAKPQEIDLKFLRYHTADQYENALDIADSDPSSAAMLLNLAVYNMLQYFFLKQKLFIPRDKDMLRQVADQNPVLGKTCHLFFRAGTFQQQLQLARDIANLTIEAQGFFEWQTQPEEV